MARLVPLVIALGVGCASACGAQAPDQNATEKALAIGLKPLKQIEICPPLFDGSFGTEPAVPSSDSLMAIVEAKLKAGGVAYTLQKQHNEVLVDRRIRELEKTTAWLHLRFQVLSLPDKKAYAFRVVAQLQAPVPHPADEKQFVFANLYEDSKVVLAAQDLTADAINGAVTELFTRFAERWVMAHKSN